MIKYIIECIKQSIKLRIYFLMVLFLVSCKSENDNVTYLSKPLYDNEIHMPKINIFQNENIVIKASSEKLLKNEGEDAILSGVVVSDFYNEMGFHISTLYSDSAIIENFTNNLKAFGNVKVVSDSGYTLFSDQILWNSQYKLVTSDDSVMFTNQFQDTLYGVGFESDTDLTHSKIYKPFGVVRERK